MLWLDCALWGKQAEALAPSLVKGQFVSVTGELSEREYERDGQTFAKLEVRVYRLDLGPRAASAADTDRRASPGAGATQQTARQGAGGAAVAELDDEIPF